MTLIVSWLNKEEEGHTSIWTAGDSKISNGDYSTLSLYGSKILELPIRCKDITTIPPQKKYFETKLTFAYAGSSFTGLNIYCTLSAIFSNLGGIESKNHLPDYNSILLKSKEIFDIYFSSIQSPTEILIAGFCPKSNKPFQGKIKPEKNENKKMKTEFIFQKYILVIFMKITLRSNY